MARELATYESAETIDVSQNTQTPVNSSPSVKGPVVSDTYEERIEDSYKDTTAATGATHVQPPEAAEDDDELHALSPQGKASAAAAKASTKQTTLQNEARREDDIQPERRPSRATKSAETDKIPRDAIEDLLSKGATARPIYADRRQQKESDLRELAKRTSLLYLRLLSLTLDTAPPDKPRPTNGKLTGLGAESSKTARKATAFTQPSSSRLKHAAPGKQTAKHKEADMPAPSVGTSSVAALRAKKDSRVQAQASTTDTNAALSAEVSEVARAAKASHAPLKERSKNLQTPARTDPKTQASGHQPTAGKLQSRMFAQTPVSRPSASAQPELKRIAMDEQEVREDDVRDDDPPTKKVRGKTPIVTGTLKRPAKSSNMPTVMPRKSTYEVPDSPPNKASAAQVQRSYANAGSGMKTQSATAGKIVKPVKSSKEPILSKKAPVSKSKPSGPTSSAGQTRKQPARKAKAAVDSPSKQLQAEHEASLSSDQECHDAAGAKKQATVEGDRGVPETIEGFEQAVVDFSGEEEPTRAVSQVLGKAIGDIKVEQSRAAHGNTQPTRDRKQGASQENAIVLSDQPQSSSPPRSLSPQPSTAPPALNTVTGKGKQAVRPPQTPAAFGSSPPTNFQGSTLPTTAGSIDPYTARKSTIISFDRSGPRNQGSLSAKKSAPGSAWTVRTSLPPKRVPLASEAGSSHANLDARRKNRPLSAATSVKSTRMNRAAPPSTIVDDKDDALAGLHEKAKQNVPTPMKVACVKYTDAPRAREPLAPQHEMAADDGFMNIDEAKGTTLVEAELAGPPPPVPKSTIVPSASQLVMPPPAPKATKSRQIHRAPTVPSMLGPDGDQPEQHNHLKHGDDMGLKRARPEEHEAAPAVKRPKMTAAPAPAVVPIKPIAVALVQKEKSSDTTSKPVPGPTKRATRKPSRHASQGNVDIHGSPVPKGMLLMDNATVLESFSQQAGLSSDQIIAALRLCTTASASPHTKPSEPSSTTSSYHHHTSRKCFRATQSHVRPRPSKTRKLSLASSLAGSIRNIS